MVENIVKIKNELNEISNINEVHFNEENVKHNIVIRMLNSLGHKNHLNLEHNYGTDRPDIIIKGFERTIIIEVKGMSVDLSDCINQVERYSYSIYPLYIILTNGNDFLFFSPFWKYGKLFRDKLILSFSRDELKNEELQTDIISILDRRLGFEKIEENIVNLERRIESKRKGINIIENDITEIKNKTEQLERENIIISSNKDIEKLKDLIHNSINYSNDKLIIDAEQYLKLLDKLKTLEEKKKIVIKSMPSLSKNVISKNKHIRKIKLIDNRELSTDSGIHKIAKTNAFDVVIYQTNDLFDELNEWICKLGVDIEIKERKTMRCFYSFNVAEKRRGLVWLEPKEYSLIVRLRKGDYTAVDKEHKINYSKPKSKTLGDYPVLTITDRQGIHYAYNMIKYAYGNL